MGDGFYRSKDPTNSIKVLKEKCYKEKLKKAKSKIHIYIQNYTIKSNYCSSSINRQNYKIVRHTVWLL